ncbi:CG0192-related protein [Curtobacterium sp. SP.BCo]|uniref:CG0192-related protein n=1 Tax=Curtobacterium sp. SP.BCo TaxID=3435229 RepID=UPI003F739351
MAVIHRAELRPSKLEALAAWLPDQPWSGVTAGEDLGIPGKFRFDDPAGEVGVETILVRTASGRVLHAPLTYRGAPLEGADDFLVTEMDHSVLGRRWVYDASGDPVYADVLRRAIATGGHEAELTRDGAPGTWEKEGTATGSGTAQDSPTVTSVAARTTGDTTMIDTGDGTLVLARVVGAALPAGETLTAAWSEGSGVLAVLLP